MIMTAPEAGKRVETGKTLQVLRALLSLGPPLLALFLALLFLFNVMPQSIPPGWIFEAPLLLLVLNTLFLSIIPLIVAFFALRSYLSGGPSHILFLGCGMLSFGLACFVAGWYGAQTEANVNFTVHNTGILLASVSHFLGGVVPFFEKFLPKDQEKRKKYFPILTYLGIVIFMAGLLLATRQGYTPAFYIFGSGPTILREVVLTAAIFFFGTSSFLIAVFDRFRRSFFLSFYAMALALITIGLIALLTSVRANSALSWLGRSAQYMAGVYFLAAAVAAVQAAWANRWTVPDAVADFFRHSEVLYREVVETATDAIIQVNASREIFLWNTAAERIFEYSRVEATRLTLSDLIDPEDLNTLFRDIEAGLASGRTRLIREVEARRKSGEKFPAEFSISSRRSGRGLILTLVIRNITARKRAEKQLKDIGEKYSTLFDTTSDGVWLHNLKGEILEVNDAYCRMSGYTREEIIGMPISRLEAVESPQEITNHIKKILERGGSDRFESQHRRKDGSVFDVDITALYLEREGGQIAIFTRDITRRRRAEEALRKERDFSAAVLETAGALVVVLDKEGRITRFNRACEAISGYSVAEVSGRVFWEFLVPPEEIQGVMQTWEALQGGNFPNRHENQWVAKNGSRSIIAWSNTAIVSPQGKIEYIIATGVDITERKRAETVLQQKTLELLQLNQTLEQRIQERTIALRESEERLRDLTTKLLHVQELERKAVANDIHDGLLSDLAAVNYSLEAKILTMEKGNHPLAADLRKILTIHQKTIKEARRIMNNLRPSLLDELGLIPAMNWFCREFQGLYPQIQLECKLDVLEEEVPDPIKVVIFRVSQEALTNFAKHGKGNLLELSLLKSENTLHLKIQDNGQGFDIEKVPKGLGLESMRERVELSGGPFHIESVEGKGTTIQASWSLGGNV